ncbi:hypothetical protein ACPPVO_22440 [Dactylosporangium sp. McL0621]|uniref:hypothetical protein n=1 Tax=Dactylosporangium sp. McL0621 TaxID=3415678 RepID=UPI003CF536F0
MTRTFTDQEIRNLAGRLRAANCEPGTDRDGYDASYAIEQLLRERGALAAQMELVRANADPGLLAKLDEVPW